MSRRLVAFDLDDTLAVSRQPIHPYMASALERLVREYEVCVITGGTYEQIEEQVILRMDLPTEMLKRFHVMPTCGTAYYRYKGVVGFQPVYEDNLTDIEVEMVAAALRECASDLGLWDPDDKVAGPRVENRGWRVTFSALGRQAPPDAEEAWDPDAAKREKLRAAVQEKVPDLEVRSGGPASIDVSRRGIDKAYGIRRLMATLGLSADDVLFLGDRLDEGGNDYPVRATGVECWPVDGWEDTVEKIKTLLPEGK